MIDKLTLIYRLLVKNPAKLIMILATVWMCYYVNNNYQDYSEDKFKIISHFELGREVHYTVLDKYNSVVVKSYKGDDKYEVRGDELIETSWKLEYIFILVGAVILTIAVIVMTLGDDDDFSWEYRRIKLGMHSKYLGLYHENNEYILLYKDKYLLGIYTEKPKDYEMGSKLRKFLNDDRNLYEKYNTLSQKRDKKINSII